MMTMAVIEAISLDRFQVTQHHNQPALQGRATWCMSGVSPHLLPTLTLPSPHTPTPPTYILASLPKEHVLSAHCTHYEGSPHRCQLHRVRQETFLSAACNKSTVALQVPTQVLHSNIGVNKSLLVVVL